MRKKFAFTEQYAGSGSVTTPPRPASGCFDPLKQYSGSRIVAAPPQPASGYLDFLADQVAARLTDDPAFLENLTTKTTTIENLRALAEVTAKIEEWLEEQEQQNSPFGPVFIADLQPDRYSEELDKELERLATVRPIEDNLFSEPD